MNVLIDFPINEFYLDKLRDLPDVNVKIVDPSEERSRLLPNELIENCDALLCTFPPENHEEMTRLKVLQISSVGFNQVIGKGFEDRGVKVCNVRGAFDVPIAEWNVSMMINLARDTRAMIENQESRAWDRNARFQTEIRGSVLGIWGYGGIGRETARLAKALGLKVHVLTRSGVKPRDNIYNVPETGDVMGVLPDRVFIMEEKETFLNGLDFLILSVPLTKSTEGVIGEDELKMLNPNAFLLNPARGPLVKEQALIRALQEGWIAGAALDTHYYYPMPKEHPLWRMRNVIMTPHISGSTGSQYFLERTWDIFYQNVIRTKENKVLLNELSRSSLRGE